MGCESISGLTSFWKSGPTKTPMRSRPVPWARPYFRVGRYMDDDAVSWMKGVLYFRGIPSSATSLGDIPAMAVAIGRATANPPGPTTAVAKGFDEATPPTPAIASPGKIIRFFN